MNDSSVNQVTLTMPRLGETMERGTVAEWLVEEGHAFKRGDSIVEFETDKTAVEYPALGDGVLMQQLVQPGDLVEVGEAIAWIDIGNGPDWISEAPNETESGDGAVAPDTDTDTDTVKASTVDNSAIRATPVARKLARQHGLQLEDIVGTGRRGRVEAHDVDAKSNSMGPQDLHYVDGIAYRVSGPESGLPVLLLHGFAADGSAWGMLTRALLKANCRVLAVDLPGHGATQVEASDVYSLASGLAKVVSANSDGACSWQLVAHSLGTVPALELAQSDALWSIASLSLIAPVGLGLTIDQQFVRGMAAPSSAAELSHLLRRLSNQPSTMSDMAIASLFRQLKRGRLENLADSMLGVHGQAINCHDAINTLSKQILVKVLIGHTDRIVDWQDTLSIAPSVAVHHFPMAGHMPHWDHPDEVAQIVLSGCT